MSPILSGVRLRCKAIIGCALVAACGTRSSPPADSAANARDSTATSAPVAADTAPDTSASQVAVVQPAAPPRSLSPSADSITPRLVFVPRTETWFLAQARGKRMLVDIGRVDLEVSRPPSRHAAYREAVAARSPLPAGTRLRLRGAWGADDVEVAGFDVWNGRIVATVKGDPRIDSLAKKVDPLVAVAQRADTATPPFNRACADSADEGFTKRLEALRDSVLEVLRLGDKPVFPRLLASLKERSSYQVGCMQGAKAVLVVSVAGGDYEWVRERVLLVAGDGNAKPLVLKDFRFRVHDFVGLVDADEDGFDEIAARAYTERSGGTVVLKLVEGKRLERVTQGFAWER